MNKHVLRKIIRQNSSIQEGCKKELLKKDIHILTKHQVFFSSEWRYLKTIYCEIYERKLYMPYLWMFEKECDFPDCDYWFRIIVDNRYRHKGFELANIEFYFTNIFMAQDFISCILIEHNFSKVESITLGHKLSLEEPFLTFLSHNNTCSTHRVAALVVYSKNYSVSVIKSKNSNCCAYYAYLKRIHLRLDQLRTLDPIFVREMGDEAILTYLFDMFLANASNLAEICRFLLHKRELTDFSEFIAQNMFLSSDIDAFFSLIHKYCSSNLFCSLLDHQILCVPNMFNTLGTACLKKYGRSICTSDLLLANIETELVRLIIREFYDPLEYSYSDNTTLFERYGVDFLYDRTYIQWYFSNRDVHDLHLAAKDYELDGCPDYAALRNSSTMFSHNVNLGGTNVRGFDSRVLLSKIGQVFVDLNLGQFSDRDLICVFDASKSNYLLGKVCKSLLFRRTDNLDIKRMVQHDSTLLRVFSGMLDLGLGELQPYLHLKECVQHVIETRKLSDIMGYIAIYGTFYNYKQILGEFVEGELMRGSTLGFVSIYKCISFDIKERYHILEGSLRKAILGDNVLNELIMLQDMTIVSWIIDYVNRASNIQVYLHFLSCINVMVSLDICRLVRSRLVIIDPSPPLLLHKMLFFALGNIECYNGWEVLDLFCITSNPSYIYYYRNLLSQSSLEVKEKCFKLIYSDLYLQKAVYDTFLDDLKESPEICGFLNNLSGLYTDVLVSNNAGCLNNIYLEKVLNLVNPGKCPIQIGNIAKAICGGCDGFLKDILATKFTYLLSPEVCKLMKYAVEKTLFVYRNKPYNMQRDVLNMVRTFINISRDTPEIKGLIFYCRKHDLDDILNVLPWIDIEDEVTCEMLNSDQDVECLRLGKIYVTRMQKSGFSLPTDNLPFYNSIFPYFPIFPEYIIAYKHMLLLKEFLYSPDNYHGTIGIEFLKTYFKYREHFIDHEITSFMINESILGSVRVKHRLIQSKVIDNWLLYILKYDKDNLIVESASELWLERNCNTQLVIKEDIDRLMELVETFDTIALEKVVSEIINKYLGLITKTSCKLVCAALEVNIYEDIIVEHAIACETCRFKNHLHLWRLKRIDPAKVLVDEHVVPEVLADEVFKETGNTFYYKFLSLEMKLKILEKGDLSVIDYLEPSLNVERCIFDAGPIACIQYVLRYPRDFGNFQLVFNKAVELKDVDCLIDEKFVPWLINASLKNFRNVQSLLRLFVRFGAWNRTFEIYDGNLQDAIFILSNGGMLDNFHSIDNKIVSDWLDCVKLLKYNLK